MKMPSRGLLSNAHNKVKAAVQPKVRMMPAPQPGVLDGAARGMANGIGAAPQGPDMASPAAMDYIGSFNKMPRGQGAGWQMDPGRTAQDMGQGLGGSLGSAIGQPPAPGAGERLSPGLYRGADGSIQRGRPTAPAAPRMATPMRKGGLSSWGDPRGAATQIANQMGPVQSYLK